MHCSQRDQARITESIGHYVMVNLQSLQTFIINMCISVKVEGLTSSLKEKQSFAVLNLAK